MTLQGWTEAVERAKTDEEMAALIARLLYEQDQAKEALRRKGYGCIGMPWLEMVDEVPTA